MIDQIDNEDYESPNWVIEGWGYLSKFQKLDLKEKSELVAQAATIFGTLLLSLTPDGVEEVSKSGEEFFSANKYLLANKYPDLTTEKMLYLMLGVAVESMGIQEMRLKEKDQL